MMPLSQDVHPLVLAFLERFNNSGAPPVESLTPTEARKAGETFQQQNQKSCNSGVTLQRQVINVDGRSVPLHVITPARATVQLPVFMFFHGGGWVLGDFPTHQRLVTDLVRLSGAACVFVDYSLSPEVRFPIAIEQAYSATCWIAANGSVLGLDGSRISVVGNSSGANMATVVCMMAKARGGPKIASQVLMRPITDARCDTASYREWADGYFLTRSMMDWFWSNYLESNEQRRLHLVSPLQATRDQLKGLPPALIQTAECDVVRDEGEAYGRALASAGVDVSSIRYNGLIHDFGMLNPLAKIPAVRTALRQAAYELRYHLSC